MKCEQAEEILADIFDADCAEPSPPDLVFHLCACVECRKLVANLLLVKALGRVARELWGTAETCQVF